MPYLCVSSLYNIRYDENGLSCGCDLIETKYFEGIGCEVEFVRYLTSAVPPKTTCFSHNGAAFDNVFLINSLYKLPILPELLVNGTKFVQINLVNREIRLLDSFSYIPFALRKFGKIFGIRDEKTWFPHRLVTSANLYTKFVKYPST